MSPKKTPTAVDQDGLRTHCPDGHRLYWLPEVRLAAAAAMAKFQASNSVYDHPLSHSCSGAVCSAGQHWMQRAGSLRNQKERDGARRNGRAFPDPVFAAPVMEDFLMGVRWTSGGLAFEIKIDAGGHRTVQSRLRCNFYTDRQRDHKVTHAAIEAQPATEAEFLALRQSLIDAGWQIDNYGTLCPTCLEERAHSRQFLAFCQAQAQVLEAEDRDRSVTTTPPLASVG